MSLTKQDVEYIAHLARLQLASGEAEKYTEDLSNILDGATQMNEVDTTSIEPMAHPMDLPQRLREDEVTETDQRTLFQSIAPNTADGFYLVPKVIDE